MQSWTSRYVRQKTCGTLPSIANAVLPKSHHSLGSVTVNHCTWGDFRVVPFFSRKCPHRSKVQHSFYSAHIVRDRVPKQCFLVDHNSGILGFLVSLFLLASSCVAIAELQILSFRLLFITGLSKYLVCKRRCRHLTLYLSNTSM